MDPAAKLLEQALRLSTPQRAQMARELLASLDDGADDAGDAEAEWIREASARLDEVESGAVTPEDWETVRAALRRDRPGGAR
jgi:putative addiction module component (TIGR02574 family)